jgi:molecular chaperone GrpE (heat shock protein)
VDFEGELAELLAKEEEPLPREEPGELAAALRYMLNAFGEKQTNFSLQIEEIYDMLSSQNTQALQEALSSEKKRADYLVMTILGLCDVLEDFYAYARQSGREELRDQGEILWRNSGTLLAGCGILRQGTEGEELDMRIHSVKGAVDSPLPREQVVRVLQSGYVYMGTVLRKAAVMLSRGPAETGEIEEDLQEKGEQ